MATEQLGKYELQECLGRGGMGEVWKAFDTQLRRYVAVKLLHANLQANPDFVHHFMREAQFVASLHHPHIVQIHDFQFVSGTGSVVKAYMVMDYIEGGTLADYIRRTSRRGLFPSAHDILHLLTGISLALDYAHHKGMIHRDIKPANILLDTSVSQGRIPGEPILTDFGIAKLQGTGASTLTNAMLGTPLYVSPEQASNDEIDEHTDLYSLGIILYELLTGVTPFRGDNAMMIMMQHVSSIPTPPALINPNIPSALSAVVLQAISKDPMARFPTASAMTVAVAHALSLPIPAPLNTGDNTVIQPDTHALQSLSQQPSPASIQPYHSSHSLSLSGSTISSPIVPEPAPSPITIQGIQGANVVHTPSLPTTNDATGVTGVAYTLPQQHTSSPALSTTPPPIQPNAGTRAAPAKNPFFTGRKSLLLFLAAGVLIVLVAVSIFAVPPLLGSQHRATGGQPGDSSVGSITFISSQNAAPNTFDQLQVNLHSIPSPPDGKTYYAWLESSTNETSIYPHWELPLSNGGVNSLYSDSTHTQDLFASSTLFLITEETTGSAPIIPIPDLSLHRYYASISHQSSASPRFEVIQCPTSDVNSANNPCI